MYSRSQQELGIDDQVVSKQAENKPAVMSLLSQTSPVHSARTLGLGSGLQ